MGSRWGFVDFRYPFLGAAFKAGYFPVVKVRDLISNRTKSELRSSQRKQQDVGGSVGKDSFLRGGCRKDRENRGLGGGRQGLRVLRPVLSGFTQQQCAF